MSRSNETVVRLTGAAFLESALHSLAGAAQAPSDRHGVLAAELAHLGYIVLRGDSADAAFMAGAALVLGARLPVEPTSLRSCTAGVVLWASPDEWLVVCRRTLRDGLLAAFGSALAGLHAQVVDNSGGLTCLRLAGADHLRVLRHLGPYDFERLSVGRCVGTVFSKTAVSIARSDDAGVMLVFRRSFADYTWRLLQRAARPYGLCVTHPLACPDPLFTPLLQPA